MKSILIKWMFTGLLLLGICMVLGYITVFTYSRVQVGYLIGRGGPSVTDFALPYLFVINRGSILGILFALFILAYGLIQPDLSTVQSFNRQSRFIRLTLLFGPLLVAVVSALILSFYLEQVENIFSRFDRFLQP